MMEQKWHKLLDWELYAWHKVEMNALLYRKRIDTITIVNNTLIDSFSQMPIVAIT